MKAKLLLVNYLIVGAFCTSNKCAVVQLSSGKIGGSTEISDAGFEYQVFRGVPYAKPPLGPLRFQPPQPVERWSEVKDATQFGPLCPQIDGKSKEVVGSEDCLKLNVYIKQIDKSKPKAVMVWFHGGGHITGTSNVFGGEYLSEKDVIVVTVNYRLNVFGFFTTNDENAYGNIAVKDQILALKWVQENIAEFGGDPTKVTIFGESSGSNSVSLLQLSPRGKGLFHYVIGQSGSSLSPRYLQRNPLPYSLELAKKLNVDTKSTKTMVDGLKNVTYKKLMEAAGRMIQDHMDLNAGPFFPIIETKNQDSIIDEAPYQILADGRNIKVPFLVGINSNEGTLGIRILDQSNRVNLQDFDTNYELFTPLSLNLETQEEKVRVGKIIHDFYLKQSLVTEVKLSKYLANQIIVRGVQRELDLKRKHYPGYFYRFSYRGQNVTKLGGCPDKGTKRLYLDNGVGHAEELQYIFHLLDRPALSTSEDILTRQRMVEMWTNFAKFGTPTPKKNILLQKTIWKVTNATEVNTLDIGNNLVMINIPNQNEYDFWNNLFEKYGRKPYINF